MAARSRPRGGQLKEEFDEERSIWNSIKADGRRVDQLMVRHIAVFVVIVGSSLFYISFRNKVLPWRHLVQELDYLVPLEDFNESCRTQLASHVMTCSTPNIPEEHVTTTPPDMP